jgi:hypothetical protein
VQDVAQPCVLRHRLEDRAQERENHRIGIGDEQQDWPFALRKLALCLRIPFFPDNAGVGKIGEIGRRGHGHHTSPTAVCLKSHALPGRRVAAQ